MSAPPLAAVRGLVGRARLFARAEDASAGAIAFLEGMCALRMAVGAASGGAGLALAAALGVAFAGAACAACGTWLVARALFRPPSAAAAAGWIERALPGLRDSLATAVEGGPLARVSAEYAAPWIAGARAGALLPAAGRRARAAVVVAATAALCAGLAVGSRSPEGAPPVPARSLPGAAASADGRGAPVGPRGEGVAPEVVRGAPRRAGLTVRAAASPRPRARAAGPVDATEILLRSPVGFERAVEAFLSGGPPEDGSPQGPEPGREDAPLR